MDDKVIKNIITISAKDLRSSFVSPIAFVTIASYVFLSGYFFFALIQGFNELLSRAAMIGEINPSLNQFVIEPYYHTIAIVLVFTVPLLTMRSIAEENSRGTLDLLLTSTLELFEIVTGKFLASAILLFTVVSLSFAFPLILYSLTTVELLPMVVGFLGLLLFALFLTSIGIACSSLTKNQTIAGVVSIVVGLALYACDTPGRKLGGKLGAILVYLSPLSHLEELLKGVVQSVDLIYFPSATILGLFITVKALDFLRAY